MGQSIPTASEVSLDYFHWNIVFALKSGTQGISPKPESPLAQLLEGKYGFEVFDHSKPGCGRNTQQKNQHKSISLCKEVFYKAQRVLGRLVKPRRVSL